MVTPLKVGLIIFSAWMQHSHLPLLLGALHLRIVNCTTSIGKSLTYRILLSLPVIYFLVYTSTVTLFSPTIRRLRLSSNVSCR